jgi:acetyl esterase/lipase
MKARSRSFLLILTGTLCPLVVYAAASRPAQLRLVPTGRPAGNLPSDEKGTPACLAPVLPDGVTATKNIAYATVGGKSLLLDLYVPESEGGPMPLVIWIHGGSWRAGTKAACLALPLTERGYAVASIEYRLSGVATWPAQIYDCKAAIRFLRAHAGEYNIDPDRIGVWGNSAGGHLAAFLGVSGDMKEFEGNEGNPDHSSRVQAVCDWCGPTDLPLIVEQLAAADLPAAPKRAVSDLLGGPLTEYLDRAREASPVNWVTPDDAAFLIVHGDRDRLVPLSQSEALYNALRDNGVESRLLVLPGAGHAQRGLNHPKVTKAVEDFFDRTLKSTDRRVEEPDRLRLRPTG